MQSVAIVGVGLIGGSFGLALRKAGFRGEIVGVSSPSAIQAGLASGAITSSATLEGAAACSDLIYLAQPVDRILETIALLGPLSRSGSLVTDAGSTKAEIVACAVRSIRAADFIGGHPLAGKEQRGAAAADADLFRNRPYVLTPMGADNGNRREFRSWLSRIGANVVEMPADEHDSTVALTSHLPQLISTALAHLLKNANKPQLTSIFGPGLLDMTRLALSAPDVWGSILETNREQVISALDSYIATLTGLRESIGTAQLADYFTSAAKFASHLRL